MKNTKVHLGIIKLFSVCLCVCVIPLIIVWMWFNFIVYYDAFV